MRNVILKKIATVIWQSRPKPRKKVSTNREPLKPRLRALFRSWLLFFLLIPLLFLVQSTLVDRDGSLNESLELVDTVEDTGSKETGTDANSMKAKSNETTTENLKVVFRKTTTQKAITATTAGPPPKPPCPARQESYGKTNLTITNVTMEFLSTRLKPIFSLVKNGGYRPTECSARHKVAILVPYRDRERNLAIFLYNIHPFLIKQKIEYRIFVLEQYGKELFNKGILYNAGFKEMQKYGHFACIVLHDVDLLPMHERILYGCPIYPRHMCSTVLEKKNDTSFRTIFGGVVAMTCEHFQRANGFSNLYWGWGGEDNDMFWRLRAARLPVVRYDKRIAEYISLPHPTRPVNPYRYMLINTARERYQDEGLSTVAYRLVSQKNYLLYTHMLFDVNPYRENLKSLMRYYAEKQFEHKARKHRSVDIYERSLEIYATKKGIKTG